MSEKTKNTIIVQEPSAKSAQELLKVLAEKDVADIVRVNTPEEVLQNVISCLPCMLITSINDNQDVPLRIQLFKRLETAIKQHGLKIYVVTPLKNRQLSDMITQKMGVADYIVEPVAVRTMQFKANLQLKAIDNFRRQQELKKAASEQVTIKKLDNAKKADASASADVKSGSKPALQAGEDTFLFKNSGVRKAGKKYTLELEGPDPSTGEWLPHEDKGDAQSSWRWVPNEEKEKQEKGETPKDGWVHKGDKPVFNESSGKWAMTSETPSLTLQQKGETKAEKVGLDAAGDVVVAEDSPAAEENLRKNKAKVVLQKRERERARKATAGEIFGEGKEPGAAPEGAPPAEGAAPAKAPKAGQPSDKLKGLRSRLGENDSAEEGAGELSDQRDPNADGEPTELRDKRGPSGEKLKGITGGLEGQAAEELSDPPKEKLRLLQKLREKKDHDLNQGASGEENPVDADAAEPGEDGNAGGPVTRDVKAKRKKTKKDEVSRLKSLLGDEEDAGDTEEDSSAQAGAEAEEEGAGGGGGGRPSLKAGGSRGKKKDAPPADPASRLGELRDRQGEGADERKLGLRDQRADVMSKIQDLLGQPIPEDIGTEEEEALREELGLKGRPEIKASDLVKRKRLKEAKALRKRLADLDAELDEQEEEGEAVSSAGLRDEPADEDTRRKGDLSAEKLKGIRGAFDDGTSDEELEEENRKRLKNKIEERRRREGQQDKANYLPEADIQPLGNAWEATGTHYVYLNANVRYRGFGKLEELLPLWIFEGEDVPQLLDKSKQWRFLGGLPFQAATVADIPKPVRDFLVGLRDQLAKAGVEVPGDDEDRAEDLLDEQEDASADGADPEGDDSSERKTKGEKDRKKRDLKDLLGDEADADSDETEDPEPLSAGDKLASLRAKLGMDDEDESEPESESPSDGEKAPGDAVAALSESKSEGVQRFLERRKKQADAGAAQPDPVAEEKRRQLRSGYVGIYVALSDAYGSQRATSASVARVLASIEGSFKDCVALVTTAPDEEGNVSALHAAKGQSAPVEKFALASGLAEPISGTGGDTGKVLGYLFLRASGPRQGFEDAEEATFRRLAKKIWPLVNQAGSESERVAA